MNAFRSIRAKLLAISLACVVVALGAATAANSYVFYTEYRRALEAHALIVAKSLRLQLERMLNLGIFLGELDGFDQQCREAVDAHEAIVYAWVADSNGQLVFSSNRTAGILPGKVGGPDFDRGVLTAPEHTGESADGEHLEVSVPLSDVSGAYVGRIGVGIPFDRIRDQTSWLALVSIGTALLFTVAALLWLGYMLRRAVTSPLQRLLSAIRGMSEKPFDHDSGLGPLPADEIGVIGRAFNDMSATLKRTHAALQKDIARRKEAEERLAYMAHYDSLTGIPNRVFFVEYMERRLSEAQRHDKRLALLFVDLDRFKWVNDTLGHTLGDALLVEVADRLQRHLRGEDLVARLGGDEFVVVVEALPDNEIAAQIAQKLIAEMEQPVQLEGQEVVVTFSIGISVFPEDGGDLATLMKNADTAMYKAKEAGKNNFKRFCPAMQAESSRRITLEADLRNAVQAQELELDYQPVVSVRGGELIGMEALLRWRHPKLGRLSPADFLESAEESGLIVPVGEWVLRRACEDAARLRRRVAGRFAVGVNVSVVQLRHPSFAATVLEAIEAARLEPENLLLELTEFALMHDIGTKDSVLRTLKDEGVSLAIDDFGTGYSSLSHLQHLPVECLKVDRSFISDLAHDRDSRAIAEAVIALGHKLGLKVVAEGVETREQVDWLAEQSCDALQGYYISPPGPLASVERRMRSARQAPRSDPDGSPEPGLA